MPLHSLGVPTTQRKDAIKAPGPTSPSSAGKRTPGPGLTPIAQNAATKGPLHVPSLGTHRGAPQSPAARAAHYRQDRVTAVCPLPAKETLKTEGEATGAELLFFMEGAFPVPMQGTPISWAVLEDISGNCAILINRKVHKISMWNNIHAFLYIQYHFFRVAFKVLSFFNFGFGLCSCLLMVTGMLAP